MPQAQGESEPAEPVLPSPQDLGVAAGLLLKDLETRHCRVTATPPGPGLPSTPGPGRAEMQMGGSPVAWGQHPWGGAAGEKGVCLLREIGRETHKTPGFPRS